MPYFEDGGKTHQINRRATLLDTGVFVAAFSRHENQALHENARLSLDYPVESNTNQWIVPSPVIVESWGQLAGGGRLKDREGARAMLAWINDPANPVVVVRSSTSALLIEDIVSANSVDVVDAMLIDLAEQISAQCGLDPPVQLATFDTRDFSRMKNRRNSAVRIYDVKTLQGED